MNTASREVHFDGIIGNTHHFGGLAHGNLASTQHHHETSHPRAAALQGLSKMKQLMDLGIVQAVLPPQLRPNIQALKDLGFSGSETAILKQAASQRPDLLSAVSSASCAWTANAATVSPAADAGDGKTHITPANLASQMHRLLEVPQTTRILRQIFHDPQRFTVHDPLPRGAHYGDEGAANHTRLCAHFDEPGIELFVYGREATEPATLGPKRFPARQTFEACLAVSQYHGLSPAHTVFARQNPACIEAGVFHSDVILVGNQDLLLYHESAFLPQDNVIETIAARFQKRAGSVLILIPVSETELPLQEAVQTYFFNSQLVTLPDGKMALVLPRECEQSELTQALLKKIIEGDNPVNQAHYVDLGESMKNGGGPACLRLRVVLTPAELECLHQPVLLTPKLYNTLAGWVQTHYRETLHINDLADPILLEESRRALKDLEGILKLDLLPSPAGE